MTQLADRRCRNHPGREAVVLCPGCHDFYCRECVSEHDDLMLCSACIRKRLGKGESLRSGFAGILRAVQAIAGFLLLWLFFYCLGRALLTLPSSFHEGTVWKNLFNYVGRGGR